MGSTRSRKLQSALSLGLLAAVGAAAAPAHAAPISSPSQAETLQYIFDKGSLHSSWAAENRLKFCGTDQFIRKDTTTGGEKFAIFGAMGVTAAVPALSVFTFPGLVIGALASDGDGAYDTRFAKSASAECAKVPASQRPSEIRTESQSKAWNKVCQLVTEAKWMRGSPIEALRLANLKLRDDGFASCFSTSTFIDKAKNLRPDASAVELANLAYRNVVDSGGKYFDAPLAKIGVSKYPDQVPHAEEFYCKFRSGQIDLFASSPDKLTQQVMDENYPTLQEGKGQKTTLRQVYDVAERYALAYHVRCPQAVPAASAPAQDRAANPVGRF